MTASPRRIGLGMWLAFWVLVAAFGTWGFSLLLDHRQNPNQQVQTSVGDGGAREVVLERNRGGHFVATGRINGREVTFLLDTGASDVSIPGDVAERLALERGAAVRYSTASGTTTGYLTDLDSVAIGGIELTDVRGSINPAAPFDQVLLGMSFLRRIEFTQRGDELILRQR